MIFMTPTQSKQAAAIMQKHGEEGWRIEYKHRGDPTLHWGSVAESLMWNWYAANHRAVRTERTPTRTPLPIEHYRRGMEVKNECEVVALVVDLRLDGSIEIAWKGQSSSVIRKTNHFTAWRWPNETEWQPAFTETVEEREVETLIVEGL